jgi:hypothetical protein
VPFVIPSHVFSTGFTLKAAVLLGKTGAAQ